MSKVKGYINLKENNDYVYDRFFIKGIRTDNKIIFKENDINVTIMFGDNRISMNRSTKDYTIRMEFVNNSSSSGSYYLNDYKKSINLNIETLSFINNDNNVYLDYNLFMADEFIGHFTYSLELEVE